MSDEGKLKSMILENAAFYDAPMNELKMKLYAAELLDCVIEEVATAFAFFRREKGRRNMPMPADIRELIRSRSPNAHLGVEEAWAMVPKNESDSVVWTKEIAEAFYSCSSLIDSDPIAARMAFKEKYLSLMITASQFAPVWSVSLGHDPAGRIAIIQDAVQKKRISAEESKKLLPNMAFQDPNTVKRVTQQQGPTAIGAIVPQITKQEKKDG